MTFKLTEKEIKDMIHALDSHHVDSSDTLIEKLSSILAWLETMPYNDRVVYLLGRNTT